MIPGTNFDTSQYNIATHPYGLQLGSTWKVMTLAAALMNGFSPNDSVSGSSPCSFGSLGQTANAEAGEGTLTIASATAQSVNCAFARIELAVGIPNVISMATKMGIDPNRPDTPGIHLDPVLTLTLGTILATPLEMATVMSTVASGGVHHAPYFVQRIVGPDGNTIYDQSSQGDRVLPEDIADCEISLLHGVITSGTGNPNAVLANNRPAFGKTGTTEDEANAAFYGGTYGQLVAFVWYGNKDANVPGAGFGGQKPAAMWRAFMDAQLAGAPAVPLPDPGPVCSRPGSAISDSGQVTGSPASSSSGTSTNSGSAPSTTPAPTPSTVATPAPTQAPAPAPAPNPPPTQPPAPPTSPPPSGPPASRP
jgi:penicillin-binding protein 1A